MSPVLGLRIAIRKVFTTDYLAYLVLISFCAAGAVLATSLR